MTVATADKKRTLEHWLKDAHAMKSARTENLERQVARFDEFPDVQRRLEDHVAHSRQQIAEIETYLGELGSDTSTTKDAVSQMMSKLQGWTTAAAPDELVKYCIADEAFAEFEAASFETLAVAAREYGEPRIAEGCARMRDEERDMADWFRAELPRITQGYLSGARQP